MRFHAECVPCLMEARLENVKDIADEYKRFEFMAGLCKIGCEADPRLDSAPMIGKRTIDLQKKLYGIGDAFKYVKVRKDFNALLMSMYNELKARVYAADDPINLAMRYSLAGNYIDFAVLKDVRPEELIRLLDEASVRELDKAEYQNLIRDLSGDGELIILHDNCGEIVLDKLLIETIKERFPNKKIASLVRRGEILNDATREDAYEIGLDKYSEILDNNMDDFSGTDVEFLSEETRRRLQSADLIISKGMGNFETISGCGLNVYYLLLSKCRYYKKWFGFEHFASVLANEKRIDYKD